MKATQWAFIKLLLARAQEMFTRAEILHINEVIQEVDAEMGGQHEPVRDARPDEPPTS